MICKEPELLLEIKKARRKILALEKRLYAAMADYICLKTSLDCFYEKEYLPRLGPYLDEMETLQNILLGKPAEKPEKRRKDPDKPPSCPSSCAMPARSKEEERELKKIYRELAKIYHPDRGCDSEEKEFLTERMSAVNEAFERRDMQALKRCLKRSEAEMGTGGRSSLSRLEYLRTDAMIIEEMAEDYRGRTKELRTGKACGVMKNVREGASGGIDVFEKMAEELASKIRSYKRILKALKIPSPV